MKNVLLAGALALAFGSAPAHAALRLAFSVGGSTFACADGQACDISPTPGALVVGSVSLGGVNIFGTFASSSTNPDALNISNLSIRNTSSSGQTLLVAVSADGYTGDENLFTGSASGTWNGAGSSTAQFGFFADGANVLGALNSTDTPGSNLLAFNDSAGAGPIAFAFNGDHDFAHGTPFSMTEGVVFSLAPGAQLVGNSEALVATPEPATWAMLLMGAAAMAWAGLRRRKSARYAF